MAGDPLTTAVGAKVDVNDDIDGHDNDDINGATIIMILLCLCWQVLISKEIQSTPFTF